MSQEVLGLVPCAVDQDNPLDKLELIMPHGAHVERIIRREEQHHLIIGLICATKRSDLHVVPDLDMVWS